MPPVPGVESWDITRDRFNKFMDLGLNIIQIAAENPHIEALQEYVGLARKWENRRMTLGAETQKTYDKWFALGKDGRKITEVLIEERLKEKAFTPEELQKKGITGEAFEVYTQIKEDFSQILDRMEKLQIAEAVRVYPADAVRQGQAIDEIKAQYAEYRSKPFFPFMRFGRYAVQILDAEGKQVHFETFDKKRQQKRALREWRDKIRRNPGGNLKGHRAVTSELSDLQRVTQSLPTPFAELTISKMQEAGIEVTEDMKQALRDLAYEKGQAKGFLKHFMRSKNVPGFSTDGLRVFAAYMSSAANFIARLEYAPQMLDQISRLKTQDRYIKQNLSGEVGELADYSRRGRIANHLEEHLQYIMSPQRELASLRAGIFAWFLGFNVKSAALNSTQLLYTTAPYLASRFGSDRKAMAAMGKALGIATKKIFKGEIADQELARLISEGMNESWIDESLSSTLAVASRADRMDQMLPTQRANLFWLKVPQWSAAMFHFTEKQNRTVTAIATYLLAKEKGMSYEEGKAEARRAVERTQFEYARWNRPKFMRGKKSVLFVFQNYVQNMLWFSLREQGAMRYWLIQLSLAGLMGLPGADDMLDLVDAAWPKIRHLFGMKGPYKQARLELRKEANEIFSQMNADPDWFLHGLSQNSFGLELLPFVDRLPLPQVDLSRSLSMGDIIPGTGILRQAANGNVDLNDALTRGSADVAGATGSAVYDALRAISSNDPDGWKRWERIMPVVLRNVSKAVRMGARGGETTRRGDRVADFNINNMQDRMELLMLSLGFQSSRLTKGWEKLIAQQEAIAYYQSLKTELLTDFNYAQSQGNTRAVEKLKKEIKQYNRMVPWPEMSITGDTLRRSYGTYLRTRAKAGQGLALQTSYIRLQRDVQEAFAPQTESADRTRREPAGR